MDIDTAKLGIVDGLIRRMLKAEGIGAGVLETDDLDAALDGADYVLVQIRVGLQARARWMSAYHSNTTLSARRRRVSGLFQGAQDNTGDYAHCPAYGGTVPGRRAD